MFINLSVMLNMLFGHLQATVAANDGDFVIPTVKPLSRGSSRHSILTSSTHDAAHSRVQGHTDQTARRFSRKTSFNLGPASTGLGLSEDAQSGTPLSPSHDSHEQQQQSKRLSFESQQQLGSEEQPVSLQHQAVSPLQSQVSGVTDAEAQKITLKQVVHKQQLEQTHASASSGVPLVKPAQTRAKAMRPIHDWVGIGSKKQLHK